MFFVAFTYILPAVTPKVEIPALTEDRVFDSITSHDFRGRIDPRLHSIELQEEIGAVKKKDATEEHKETPVPIREPANSISNEDNWHQPVQQSVAKSPTGAPLPGITRRPASSETSSQEESRVASGPPPRPKPLSIREKVDITPPAPVFRAKVIVGDFSSPKEAEMTSEILSSLHFKPFLKERNGKYVLQVASFSEAEKAKSLVEELKDRNFDARIVYE
jgi:cell division septation protein DedD